jgi:hypothetical protein
MAGYRVLVKRKIRPLLCCNKHARRIPESITEFDKAVWALARDIDYRQGGKMQALKYRDVHESILALVCADLDATHACHFNNGVHHVTEKGFDYTEFGVIAFGPKTQIRSIWSSCNVS